MKWVAVGKNKTFSYRYVAFLVGINTIFIATTAPAFWGKTNLENLLFKGGAYSDLCSPDDPPVCAAQRLAISKAFTLSIASVKLPCVFLGGLIDHAGPKVTALVGQAMFGLSIIMLANNWVALGFMTMGASMNPVFNATLSCSNLAPRRRNFVMSLLSSGGDAGYVTFWALRRLHERIGGPVKYIFYDYLIVVVFQVLVAIRFFPWKSFPVTQSPEHIADECELLVVKQNPEAKFHTKKYKNYHEMPLKRQLMTPQFWVFLPLFCLFFFKKAVYNDSLTEFLMGFPDATEARVETMKDWFSGIQALGFVWAWMFGLLADRIGVTLVISLVNGIGILVSALSLVPSLNLQLLSFVCFAMFNSYTITGAYAFVGEAYGYKHLGTLTGIHQLIAGTFVVVNVPFRSWIHYHLNGSWVIPNTILLVASILASVVPLYLWWYPPPARHALPHVRRHASSIFSMEYQGGCNCVSAGPMFTEMEFPTCSRCGEI